MKQHGETWTEGTHIVFRFVRMSDTGKTKYFQVVAKQGNVPLGNVSWFGRWRKYAFDPLPNTTYEETCLKEIAEFIEGETKNHRAAKRGM